MKRTIFTRLLSVTFALVLSLWSVSGAVFATVDDSGPSNDSTTSDRTTSDSSTGDDKTSDSTTSDSTTNDSSIGDDKTSDSTTSDSTTDDSSIGDDKTSDSTTGEGGADDFLNTNLSALLPDIDLDDDVDAPDLIALKAEIDRLIDNHKVLIDKYATAKKSFDDKNNAYETAKEAFAENEYQNFLDAKDVYHGLLYQWDEGDESVTDEMLIKAYTDAKAARDTALAVGGKIENDFNAASEALIEATAILELITTIEGELGGLLAIYIPAADTENSEIIKQQWVDYFAKLRDYNKKMGIYLKQYSKYTEKMEQYNKEYFAWSQEYGGPAGYAQLLAAYNAWEKNKKVYEETKATIEHQIKNGLASNNIRYNNKTWPDNFALNAVPPGGLFWFMTPDKTSTYYDAELNVTVHNLQQGNRPGEVIVNGPGIYTVYFHVNNWNFDAVMFIVPDSMKFPATFEFGNFAGNGGCNQIGNKVSYIQSPSIDAREKPAPPPVEPNPPVCPEKNFDKPTGEAKWQLEFVYSPLETYDILGIETETYDYSLLDFTLPETIPIDLDLDDDDEGDGTTGDGSDGDDGTTGDGSDGDGTIGDGSDVGGNGESGNDVVGDDSNSGDDVVGGNNGGNGRSGGGGGSDAVSFLSPAVPLAKPGDDDMVIFNEDVPLGDIPQTGLGDMAFSFMMLGLSLMSLMAIPFVKKRAGERD